MFLIPILKRHVLIGKLVLQIMADVSLGLPHKLMTFFCADAGLLSMFSGNCTGGRQASKAYRRQLSNCWEDALCGEQAYDVQQGCV